jgi:hypothetical protein
MRENMPFTALMSHPLETVAKMITNVMAKEPALPMDGAKEPQGLPRTSTISTTRL